MILFALRLLPALAAAAALWLWLMPALSREFEGPPPRVGDSLREAAEADARDAATRITAEWNDLREAAKGIGALYEVASMQPARIQPAIEAQARTHPIFSTLVVWHLQSGRQNGVPAGAKVDDTWRPLAVRVRETGELASDGPVLLGGASALRFAAPVFEAVKVASRSGAPPQTQQRVAAVVCVVVPWARVRERTIPSADRSALMLVDGSDRLLAAVPEFEIGKTAVDLDATLRAQLRAGTTAIEGPGASLRTFYASHPVAGPNWRVIVRRSVDLPPRPLPFHQRPARGVLFACIALVVLAGAATAGLARIGAASRSGGDIADPGVSPADLRNFAADLERAGATGTDVSAPLVDLIPVATSANRVLRELRAARTARPKSDPDTPSFRPPPPSGMPPLPGLTVPAADPASRPATPPAPVPLAPPPPPAPPPRPVAPEGPAPRAPSSESKAVLPKPPLPAPPVVPAGIPPAVRSPAPEASKPLSPASAAASQPPTLAPPSVPSTPEPAKADAPTGGFKITHVGDTFGGGKPAPLPPPLPAGAKSDPPSSVVPRAATPHAGGVMRLPEIIPPGGHAVVAPAPTRPLVPPSATPLAPPAATASADAPSMPPPAPPIAPLPPPTPAASPVPPAARPAAPIAADVLESDSDADDFLRWKESERAANRTPAAAIETPAAPLPPTPAGPIGAKAADDDEFLAWKTMPLGPRPAPPPKPATVEEKIALDELFVAPPPASEPAAPGGGPLGTALRDVPQIDGPSPIAWMPPPPPPSGFVDKGASEGGAMANAFVGLAAPPPPADPVLASKARGALDSIAESLSLDVALLLLVEPDGRNLSHAVGSAGLVPDLLAPLRIPTDERGGLVARAFRDGAGLLAAHEASDPRNDRAIHTVLGTPAFAVVPVGRAGGRRGVLIAGNLDPARAVSAADLEKLAERAGGLEADLV